MTRFTVRVELHGVKHNAEKYTQLHTEMERRGFGRTIEVNGDTYELPPAEYSIDGPRTSAKMLELAKAAAQAVMKNAKLFSILVTQTDVSRKVYNLTLKDRPIRSAG